MRSGALLAELHAHTNWSDGVRALPTLIDLYGAHGFDVLCITDHVCRTSETGDEAPNAIVAGTFDAYLAEIEREAKRAREQFGLVVVPGLELSYNDPDPGLSAHALALGLRDFVPVDTGIDEAIETAVQAGAALVAAHPFDDEPASNPGRLTQRFARDPELAARVHRFELFNRTQLFSWVARTGLPCFRERRLPPARASARLEERAPVRPRRGCRRRAPPLAAAGLHHRGRRRDRPPGRVAGASAPSGSADAPASFRRRAW